MTTGKIERAILSLQVTYHQAPFERTGNPYGQVPAINFGADFAS